MDCVSRKYFVTILVAKFCIVVKYMAFFSNFVNCSRETKFSQALSI